MRTGPAAVIAKVKFAAISHIFVAAAPVGLRAVVGVAWRAGEKHIIAAVGHILHGEAAMEIAAAFKYRFVAIHLRAPAAAVPAILRVILPQTFNGANRFLVS